MTLSLLVIAVHLHNFFFIAFFCSKTEKKKCDFKSKKPFPKQTLTKYQIYLPIELSSHVFLIFLHVADQIGKPKNVKTNILLFKIIIVKLHPIILCIIAKNETELKITSSFSCVFECIKVDLKCCEHRMFCLFVRQIVFILIMKIPAKATKTRTT